jgi:hypothetical protein
MKITEALTAVMEDVRAVGKNDRNSHQGYQFRGIDAVVNAVGPAFRKHGVICLPTVTKVEHEQAEVGSKRTLTAVVRLQVLYTFVGPEGDVLACEVAAEAMDSGDKATAKAMSVAYRTALLQVLCLPTDEPDPDHDTYERAPTRGREQQPEPPAPDYEALAARIAVADVDGLREVWSEWHKHPGWDALGPLVDTSRAQLAAT